MPAPGGPLTVCKQTQREIDAPGMTMVVMVVVVMVEPYLRPIHSCNAHRELETESRRRRRRRRRRERERDIYMSNPVREFLKEEGTHWRNQTFQRGGNSVIWYEVEHL
jgi:hypothetical protein